MYRPLLVLTCVSALCGQLLAAPPPPAELASTMSRVRTLLCERFLDPGSGRLFDYVSPDTFRLSPDMLPTAEEIRAEMPNRAGWGTPIENGPINGGILLGALVDRLGTTDPPDPKVAQIWKGHESVARPHVQNWLDCIKTRATPAVPVEVGHRSVTVCHLAGIARELGRKLRWDPDKERFPGDDEANALLDRPRRKGFELPQIA